MVLKFSSVLVFASVIFISYGSRSVNRTGTLKKSFTLSGAPSGVSGLNSSIFVGNKEIKIAKYYDQEELGTLLEKLCNDNNHIARLVVLDHTREGNRLLRAVHLSREKRPVLKPAFKFVANVHGDDAVGYALLVSLIQYLIYSYGHNPRITKMLDEIDIWIVPSLNPDGFSSAKPGCEGNDLTRYQKNSPGKTNYNGIDLEKDFPSKIMPEYTSSALRYWSLRRETKIMYDLILKHPFVLSGNIKSGALGASYFLEKSKDLKKNGDKVVLEAISKEYTSNNPMITRGHQCSTGRRKSGTSMQKTNYYLSNCFEINLFVSCCQYPPKEYLPSYWEKNLESMLKFIESTRRGIYGQVFYDNPKDGTASRAIIKVEGKEKDVKATPDKSEYWRLLPLGDYNVTASAFGCLEETKLVKLNSTNNYVQIDFVLKRRGVVGAVFDQNGNNKIKAVVKVEGEKKSIEVDDDTMYSWVTEALGTFNITASAPGFYSLTKPVTLTREERFATLNFGLTPYKSIGIAPIFIKVP